MFYTLDDLHLSLFATHCPLADTEPVKKETITYLEGVFQKAPTGDEEVSFARHWAVLTRELQESELQPRATPAIMQPPSGAGGWARVHRRPQTRCSGGAGPGSTQAVWAGAGGEGDTHNVGLRPIHHLTGVRCTDSIAPVGTKAPG